MLVLSCCLFPCEDPETQHLLGRKLIQHMLKKAGIAKMSLEELENSLSFSAFGKPDLHKSLGVHINISNCKDAVVAALCDRPVGVDIEGMRKVKHAIVKRVFSSAEFENEKLFLEDALRTKDPARIGNGDFASDTVRDDSYLSDASAEKFLSYWTLKEAYLKMTGEGFSVDPRLLTFIKDESGCVTLRRSILPEAEADPVRDVWFCQMELPGGHKLAISVDSEKEPDFEPASIEYFYEPTLL